MTMKEELMSRISAGLDSDGGIASDPALADELRKDPEAAKYAKDLSRVGKWLATWPLPEPADEAFEALASRIEQRLDESLPTMSDPTAAPVFDDDDALRDATARLLNSGEFRLSDSNIELISEPSKPDLVIVDPSGVTLLEPSNPELALAADVTQLRDSAPGGATPAESPSEAKPLSPIAKVALNKARVPTIVEEASSPGSGEPRSAAELELSLGAKPKKKKAAGATTSSAGTAAAPAAKKKKRKSDAGAASTSSDRISIPTPKPALAAPALAPVTHLPKPEERKPAATFWWFAAAAAVGLGVFGAATLFEGRTAAPAAEMAQGSTLVTTGSIAPTAPAAVPAAAPMPPPPPATTGVALAEDTPDRADGIEQARAIATAMPMPPATTAGPMARPATTAPYAPARMGAASGSGGGSGRADLAEPTDDALGDGLAAGARARRSAGDTPREAPAEEFASPTAHAATATPTTPTTPTTTTTTTTAPPPATTTTRAAPPPSAVDPSTLPATPDRETIQAVLSARAAAVTACANGAHGLADVDIVIASSGRITTATVNGTFAGTPVGSCIARAVRGATFPPFSQPRFEVTYPFHL